MGDKNIFKKSSKLFGKDGFYITLFVCLCIVAVAAVAISRNNARTAKEMAENQKQIEQQKDNAQPTLVDDGKNKTVPTVKQPDSNKKTSSTSTNTAGSTNTKKTSSTKTTSKFIMPVEGQVSKGYTKDDLEMYAIAGGEVEFKTHEAIDIKCDLGTEVKAVQGGKVLQVITGENYDPKVLTDNIYRIGMGVTVIIDHGNGLNTVYSCLGDDVKVKAGDTVKSGQVIGVVGNTNTIEVADVEGAHLHFAVIKKSSKDKVYLTENPEKYLPIKK